MHESNQKCTLLDVPGNPEIYASRADHTKQAEYAVLTLFFVALKHDWNAVRLRSILQTPAMAIAPDVIDVLVEAYAANRAQLYVHNLTTGHSLPHLSDVEWKLTCDVRSSQLTHKQTTFAVVGEEATTMTSSASTTGASGDLNYTISLGRYRSGGGGERESIATFQCNVEELIALVGRLKDAERHCERLARDMA